MLHVLISLWLLQSVDWFRPVLDPVSYPIMETHVSAI